MWSGFAIWGVCGRRGLRNMSGQGYNEGVVTLTCADVGLQN